MIVLRKSRTALAVVLAMTLIAGSIVVGNSMLHASNRIHITAYFDNTNGVFVGDEVRILGVPVGAIDSIEPQPQRAKVTFWLDDDYTVPADVKAVILAPQLVTARAIQLTPAYRSGPKLADGSTIPQTHTAVPVEWDDVRQQLEKLTDALQPTEPGGVSTLGQLINTTADNLRDQGADIRDTVIKLSQALSILGDHSTDIFSTVKNLSVLVSALHDSSDLMRQLNVNLASVTELLADDPNEVGQAVTDLNTALSDVSTFVAENRDTMGTSADKLSAVSQTLVDSLADIKEILHILPNSAQDLSNVYQPAQAALSGALAVSNLNNPIQFLCGAVEAASRMGAEQSAKLCVQYLAPIVKNRQYNFLPLGLNPFVGAQARPNEITYSEDRLRPDYVAPQPPADVAPEPPAVPPAETPAPVTPADGLQGLMLPAGVGG